MSTNHDSKRRWDPQSEDLFDYLKQQVIDQETDDHFGLEDTNILVEVLHVFNVHRGGRQVDWIDEALPGLLVLKERFHSSGGWETRLQL